MKNAADAYAAARKSALQCISERKAENQNPELPVLDTYLEHLNIVRKSPLGVQEILVGRIVGTCHESRTEAFAFNFMPLLEENTEFAAKWMNLYTSCLEEGLRDEIKVYELFGRYFVEEGNKRVSVMRALDNPVISASVTELIVDPAGLPDGELYEKYLKFRTETGISTILMTRSKNYRRLLKLIGVSRDHTLSSGARANLLSLFSSFEAVFKRRITQKITASAGDAFLIFLDMFGWDEDKIYTESELEQEFEIIRPAVMAYPDVPKAALLTKSELSARKPVLSFLANPVRAALICPGEPDTSKWTAAHVDAFREMADQLKGRVDIRIWNGASTQEKTDQALQEAVDWKADVVFTCHPIMLQSTNLFAARYPKIHFLNCSLNPESTAVRSYYTRGYELQFLQGMASGALSTTGRLGYIADYPIFGAIADINAFAIGAMMVRPDVKVYLDWSTTQSATNREFPADIDLIYISGQDFDVRIRYGKCFGLFDVRTGKFSTLSSVVQKWDVFYTRIIQSILNRTYRSDEIRSNTSSINYWLGLSNGLMDVRFSDQMPWQTRRLLRQIRTDMAEGRFFIFDGIHAPHEKGPAFPHSDSHPLSMEEIASMDWLVDSVVGELPDLDNLMPEAESLVRIHGLDYLENDDETDPKDDQKHPAHSETDEKLSAGQ